MKVLKFGGTSVGSAQRMKEVTGLVVDGSRKVVVLSAMSGTTNALVEIADYLYKKNAESANEVISTLEKKYATTIEELYSTENYKVKATEAIKAVFDHIRAFTVKNNFTAAEEKIILAQGEMMSTAMVCLYMNEQGIKAALLPALDFMRTDKNDEPDNAYIAQHIAEQLAKHKDAEILITQGYICRNINGEVDNLQRGGSDYSATLIGAAIKAEEIEIWTDIDGIHNNDPRFVEGTQPIANLHFKEAAELAYFGAKILHPTCVLPAKLTGTPIRLLNTMEPTAKGTLISDYCTPNKIEAVAAKDGITVIKITSTRMLLAYGFLRKVFEVFEKYQTPIDMITTSEVGISMTIDNDKFLNEIIEELREYGNIKYEKEMCIICVVGDLPHDNIGFQAKVVSALKDIPIRMVSYGGSSHNISFLVKAEDKKRALNALSDNLFK